MVRKIDFIKLLTAIIFIYAITGPAIFKNAAGKNNSFEYSKYYLLPEDIIVEDVHEGEIIPVDRGTFPVKNKNTWAELFVGYLFPQRTANYFIMQINFSDISKNENMFEYAACAGRIVEFATGKTDTNIQLWITEYILNRLNSDSGNTTRKLIINNTYYFEFERSENYFTVLLKNIN